MQRLGLLLAADRGAGRARLHPVLQRRAAAPGGLPRRRRDRGVQRHPGRCCSACTQPVRERSGRSGRATTRSTGRWRPRRSRRPSSRRGVGPASAGPRAISVAGIQLRAVDPPTYGAWPSRPASPCVPSRLLTAVCCARLRPRGARRRRTVATATAVRHPGARRPERAVQPHPGPARPGQRRASPPPQARLAETRAKTEAVQALVRARAAAPLPGRRSAGRRAPSSTSAASTSSVGARSTSTPPPSPTVRCSAELARTLEAARRAGEGHDRGPRPAAGRGGVRRRGAARSSWPRRPRAAAEGADHAGRRRRTGRHAPVDDGRRARPPVARPRPPRRRPRPGRSRADPGADHTAVHVSARRRHRRPNPPPARVVTGAIGRRVRPGAARQALRLRHRPARTRSTAPASPWPRGAPPACAWRTTPARRRRCSRR